MKRILICAVLLISICGCESYHGLAWYKPGNTIEQARKDCDECLYETHNRGPFGKYKKFDDCMILHGYDKCRTEDLIEKGKQVQIYTKHGLAGYASTFEYCDVASD